MTQSKGKTYRFPMLDDVRKAHLVLLTLFLAGLVGPAGCENASSTYDVVSGPLTVKFDERMHSRLTASPGGPVDLQPDFAPSEYVVLNGEQVDDFAVLDFYSSETLGLLGKGTRYTLVGMSSAGIRKSVEVTRYSDYPGMLVYRVTYRNEGREPVGISKWVNNAYALATAGANVEFWSYQGASYSDRRDWVMPLDVGFEQQNYMGMNATDYGSGTPVSVVWREDVGIAVGHLETVPKLVSIPVRYPDPDTGAEVSVQYEYDHALAPGESMSTIDTFVFAHEGDYYAALKNYRQVMGKKGLTIDEFPDSAYEAIWCAWGYERNFEVDEVLNTLPKVAELGLEWAVLDDGWQTAEGDWYLDPDKFPGGTGDMQEFVGRINDAGLKAKLWWAPLAADPGTDLLEEHEDMLLLDEDGNPQEVTWWDSYYLCPAYDKTVEHATAQVERYLKEWGYQGLKIDGQHLNGVAPCHNPAHNHARPEESLEKLQDFWKAVYDKALEIDKETVVEICPCGTSYSFFNIPYMNQSVSSDPLSSWQIRLKGKTLKALSGESAPYYGDHVELSDDGSDFASTVGIGGIVGTKFTLPSENEAATPFLLTPEREAEWAKWIAIYNDKMLPKGEYLGELYDIGFDRPETHAIRKDGSMYYAFYAEYFDGEVELRGLGDSTYRLIDYVDGDVLGEATGPVARVNVNFEGYLLIQASSAGTAEDYYSLDDFTRVPKIDAHVHLNNRDVALMEQAAADGFKLVSVNVDYPDFPSMALQREQAMWLQAEFPDVVRFIASFSAEGWEEAGFSERVIDDLGTARDEGAVGVKVWKNIGMSVRDASGDLLMIDDDRLDPIFAYLEAEGIPFLGHQGEPQNCWLPLDEMTVNNDREYFRTHPQYHMYLHPEMPSYEDQIAARDHRLEKHQDIRFIGAHLGSLEWSVDEMASFLDRFPTASLDMAARFGQLQFQSMRDRDAVRDFIIKYQDRLLYATDATTYSDDTGESVADQVRAKWLADWKYLTSDEAISVPEVDGEFRGLKLPREVIDKIYYENALLAYGLDCDQLMSRGCRQ